MGDRCLDCEERKFRFKAHTCQQVQTTGERGWSFIGATGAHPHRAALPVLGSPLWVLINTGWGWNSWDCDSWKERWCQWELSLTLVGLGALSESLWHTNEGENSGFRDLGQNNGSVMSSQSQQREEQVLTWSSRRREHCRRGEQESPNQCWVLLWLMKPSVWQRKQLFQGFPSPLACQAVSLPVWKLKSRFISPHNYSLSLAGGLGHAAVAFGQSSWQSWERQSQPPALLENLETAPELWKKPTLLLKFALNRANK